MTFRGRLAIVRCGFLLGSWLAGAAALPAQDRTWAFQPAGHPPVPAARDAARVRNPIDAFLLAKLEARHLAFAPEADRRTLIRRVTFDLTGLPPTPAEVDAFANDPRPDAYERVVERLLRSPRHGERWATFWLDLARYAETDGFKADDVRPAAWRYRDYVVAAFNADKPYDRFLKEQIAGDELYPGDAAALVATGFNRHFPDEYNAVNLEQRRQEILNDMTDTTAQVVLGLTMGCARCHDHKYDPISQEDYYRFQAFFAAYQPAEVPVGRRADVEAYRQAVRDWEAKTAEVRRKMAELEEPFRKTMAAKKKSRFPKEYLAMYETPPEKRTPLEHQIAFMLARQVEVSGDEAAKAMKGEAKQNWDGLRKQMTALARTRPAAPDSAMALTDVGPTAPPTRLLKRGDWRHPSREVQPGFPSALDEREAAVTPRETSTGRRSELARWLASADNTLAARVMVNRLWQGHFGRGLVATPSDFGAQGELPTHPELLDWLARTFIDRGWSLKDMHRLMVTSAAYRQASIADCGLRIADSQTDPQSAIRDPQSEDPENRLLWRMNRRRLEGEALRDAMLSVAGRLNARAGGPSVYPELPAELAAGKGGWPTSADPAERDRRSVYVFAKRNMRYPLFGTFDAPDANETCARRFTTTTAPQALMLLNGKVTLDVARAFAGRVLAEAGTEPGRVAEHATRLAFGRAPDAEERETMRRFLERAGGVTPEAVTDLCHALLNVNEFLYVD